MTPPIFGASGSPGAGPTLAGGWSFTVAYFEAVWKAVVVALVVAAGLESLVPRRWLVRVLTRRTRLGQGAVGGLASMPSMMCSCCTAPVAVGLRRRGVPVGAAMAYWIGNPLLNPAVLVFLALTLPWPYVTVRAVAGVVLVVVATAVVSAWLDRARGADGAADQVLAGGAGDADDDPVRWRDVPVRFGRALARLLLVLVPEYVVAVLAIGLLSGWLSDFTALGSGAGPLALLLVAVVGCALVIPTGGEVPVMIALAGAGAGLATSGVLLVALPALSVPSALMVARALSWRATAALTVAVVVTSVLAGGLLTALS